jgi:peptide/nickel transport system permease protein
MASNVRMTGIGGPARRTPAKQAARISSPWLNFAIRRTGGVLLSLCLLVVLTFLIVPLIPGDPAVAVAGQDASAEQVELIRERLGLNDPLFVQFINYVSGLLNGDLGDSFRYNESVTNILAAKLPYTLQLALFAIALVLVIAIPLGMAVGIACRAGRRRWLDASFSTLAGFFASIPGFVAGTLFIVLFALWLGILPAGGAEEPSALILPIAALALGPTFSVARVVRVETATVLEQDYMRTARGRRLPALNLYARHALPNLLTSSLTLTAIILSALIGGTIIIETVFSYPGLGTEIVNAIIFRDYPVIQGIILVVGMIATFLNLLVDILLGIIDPRTLGAKRNG